MAIRTVSLIGLRVLFLACLSDGPSAADVGLPCSVEFPAYDANGERIEIVVVSAKQLGRSGPDLLKSTGPIRARAVNGRLEIPKEFVGSIALDLRLMKADGVVFSRQVEIGDCQQRSSVQHGTNDSGVDVLGTKITGTLAGCRLTDQWWIRLLPMFGQSDPAPIHDANIRASDGRFWLTGSLRGERMILVVGKGKDPVKALGVTVVRGRDSDVGVINIAGGCPK